MRYLSFAVCFLFLSTVSYANVKIASYNIRNFDSKKGSTNKAELKKIIKKLKADIIGVEEIVNSRSFNSFIKKEFPRYKVVLSRCGGGGKQKLGMVYDSRKFTLLKSYEDNRLSDPGSVVGQYGCGRLRPAVIGIFKDNKTKKEFVIMTVHLKAGGTETSYLKREKQYKLLTRIVEELRLADYKNIVILGDFNSTGYLARDIDYSNFQDMLHKTGMKSVSRNLDCTSYWSGEDRSDNIEEASVLDHVLYPSSFLGYKVSKYGVYSHCQKSLCSNVSARELGISYRQVSDHCPVAATFK